MRDDPEDELRDFAQQVLALTLRVREECDMDDDSPALARLLLAALGVLERTAPRSAPVSGERPIVVPESALQLVLARNRRRRR